MKRTYLAVYVAGNSATFRAYERYGTVKSSGIGTAQPFWENWVER